MYEQALERGQQYGIPGVTYQLTQGVVKNIIPAIASTNAIISAACVLEAIKIITMCSSGLDNYMMWVLGLHEASGIIVVPFDHCLGMACLSPPLRYMGSQGIYTHTVAYERDADCPICGCGVPLGIDPDMTLQQVRGTGKGSSLP